MIWNFFKWLTISLLTLFLLFTAWAYLSTMQPAKQAKMPISQSAEMPTLEAGQSLKILSWNVQYMAGKNYVFFYDKLDGSGPDERPSSGDIKQTLQEVARVIIEQDPDIVLLQEVDENAKRTDYQDQLEALLLLLPEHYRAHTSAWYWQAAFVPHPRIMGRVGMKLSVISKYKMRQAWRYQLALIPQNWYMQQFNIKRALQEVRFPVRGGQDISIFNTHLSAFSQNTNTLERQVEQVYQQLKASENKGRNFIIGGDFNLLPNDAAYKRLGKVEQAYYNPETELKKLLRAYPSVPSQATMQSQDYAKHYTMFPNGSSGKSPDRTIDYLFYSPRLELGTHEVLQENTLHISDHLPIVAEFRLPK